MTWPAGRTVAWLLGCLLVLLATSSGLGRYAETQFSVHMIGHMVLGMIAPILLVLGGPITLALRVLPAAGRDRPPGARELIVSVLHSRVARVITHPLVVFVLFIASFYAIYFTGLFETMITSHVGHLLMNVHFLVIGYLYYWVIIGVDPSPRRVHPMIKLGMLVGALPFHAFFGLALMNSRQAMATSYYDSLGLPWLTDLVADQRLGGAIAWGATEIPMIIVMIALLAQWARSDERDARRSDRQGNRGGRRRARLLQPHARAARRAGSPGGARRGRRRRGRPAAGRLTVGRDHRSPGPARTGTRHRARRVVPTRHDPSTSGRRRWSPAGAPRSLVQHRMVDGVGERGGGQRCGWMRRR